MDPYSTYSVIKERSHQSFKVQVGCKYLVSLLFRFNSILLPSSGRGRECRLELAVPVVIVVVAVVVIVVVYY